LWSKLELLRNIDSIIDFSRATAQLRILIAIDRESLTVDEIVDRTGLRRKTVLDALRKLELKGVIKRKDGRYLLTDMGRSIYETLNNLILSDKNVTDLSSVRSLKPFLYDLYTDILSIAYMLEVIKIIGKRSKSRACVDELALKIGVSEATLENHLRRFSEGRTVVFKRIDDKTRGCIVYELTELGTTLYRKLYSRRRLLPTLKIWIKAILRLR